MSPTVMGGTGASLMTTDPIGASPVTIRRTSIAHPPSDYVLSTLRCTLMAVKKQPGPPRPRVTARVIVAAAIEIVDRDGVEALTIRRVAEACGLSPMGVYRHVRDKDDLLDRIVDTVVIESVDQL